MDSDVKIHLTIIKEDFSLVIFVGTEKDTVKCYSSFNVWFGNTPHLDLAYISRTIKATHLVVWGCEAFRFPFFVWLNFLINTRSQRL